MQLVGAVWGCKCLVCHQDMKMPMHWRPASHLRRNLCRQLMGVVLVQQLEPQVAKVQLLQLVSRPVEGCAKYLGSVLGALA